MARPSKYTPEVLDKAREYLKTYKSNGAVIPTVAGLALSMGVCRETVHGWALDEEEKEEFFHIYKEMMARQEEELLNNGLKGDFNSTITKLILTKHDYSDKTQTDNSHHVEVVEIQRF